MNLDKLIHLINGSWTWTSKNLPWIDRLNQSISVVEAGVTNFMIRYPFAGKEHDWEITGYREAQIENYDVCWKSFVHDVKSFGKKYGITWWIYAGYMGGGNVATCPILLKKENKPNSWRSEVDHNITPLEAIKPKVFYMDAMGGSPENNTYARWILSFRVQHELAGTTQIGIETPIPSALHWRGMPTANTWGNFESSILPRPDAGYPLGYWDYFTDPKSVFIRTGLTGEDITNKDILKDRAQQVLNKGGYVVSTWKNWTKEELESI